MNKFISLSIIFIFSSCNLISFEDYSVDSNLKGSLTTFNGESVIFLFNCDVIPYYVENSITLKKEENTCEVNYQWLSPSLVTIRPKEGWVKGNFYQCELKGNIYEKSGITFSVNENCSFIYGSSEEKFILVKAPFEEDSFEQDESLVFEFNYSVDRAKFDDCFIFDSSVPYRIEVSDDNKIYKIIPVSKWAINESLNWSLNELVANDNLILSGKREGKINIIRDFNRPELLKICAVESFSEDAVWYTELLLNKNISKKMPIGFIFSKSMNIDSVRNGIDITPSVNGYFTCISDNYEKFLFIPEENYAIETEYLISVNSDIMDKDQIKLVRDYREKFVSGDSYLYIKTIQLENESSINIQNENIPECIDVNLGEDISGEKEMSAYILFSSSIKDENLLKVENMISLSLVFPLTSANPVKTAVTWNSTRDIITVTWKNMTVSSDDVDSFYKFEVTGGKTGVDTGNGNYLKESLCMYLKFY